MPVRPKNLPFEVAVKVFAFAAWVFLIAQLASAATEFVAERKPYALFGGMDLQVQTDDGTFPVVGFTKKRIMIARNGTNDPLATDSRITYALRKKLSAKWIDLKVLETERFYSRANSDFAAYSSAVTQYEREQDRRVDYAIGRRTNGLPSDPKITRRPSPVDPSLQDPVAGALGPETYEGLSRELEDKLLDPEAYADSLKVVLSLASDELLKGVYLVLIASIDSPGTEPDARPFIQIVGQLKPENERRVKVVFRDLPEGFSLLGLEVHAYSKGEELPHHGSKNLRLLTEEEAFEYSLGKYMEAGGQAEPKLFRSLRAEAITSFVSEKEILRIQANLIVHPDGSTTVDYLNTRDQPLADRLVGVLESVRFLPAIQDGQPTESRISLSLSSLVD